MSYAIVDAILPKTRTYYAVRYWRDGSREVVTFTSKKRRREWVEKYNTEGRWGERAYEITAKRAKQILEGK